MTEQPERCVGPGGLCAELVVGYVELGAERCPLCRRHTIELAHDLLERLGFVVELAAGRTGAELAVRLDKRIVESLERCRVRQAMRA